MDFKDIQAQKQKPTDGKPADELVIIGSPAETAKNNNTENQKDKQSSNSQKPVPFENKFFAVTLLVILLTGVAVGFYQMGRINTKDESKSESETPIAFEPKKVEKLPFDLPDYIQGEVVDVLDFGNFFLVGTKFGDGQVEYITLSKDGKFTLIGYVIDNKAKTAIYDVHGRISDEDRQKNRITENLVGQANPSGQTDGGEGLNLNDFPTQSQLGDDGLPENYFKVDFTTDKTFVVTAKNNAQTMAVGDFKANPDLFVRHLFEQIYKTTLNSDSLTGKYNNAPMSPLYVFYDPRCPACQEEMPIVEQYRTQGYDIIYVPTGALASDDELQNADESFIARTLNPAKGKEPLLKTLDNGYQKSTTAKADELVQDKAMLINNTSLFKSLPTLLNSYYQDKQTKSFSPITALGVPAVMYVDKNTGEVVLEQVDLKRQLGS